MDPNETYLPASANIGSFSYAVASASSSAQEYNNPPATYSASDDVKMAEPAAIDAIRGARSQTVAEKPSSGCSAYNGTRKSSGEQFSSFQSISRQFNNMPNNGPLNSSIQKAMYEMYNMTALTDSVGENENMEARNSVLEAILEIEFCNIPLRQEVLDSVIASDSTKKAQLKYSDYLQIESNPTLHNLENERLEELKAACTLLRNPYQNVVHKTSALVDAVKVTEAAIRRLIKMSKRLSAFNKLSQNDQISLLKGSIIEMMCIRATTTFNSEHNYWYFIDDINQGLTVVSLDVLKNANWINFMSHKNFAIKFNNQFNSQPLIADLLTAIILFRPSRASTSNQELIRYVFVDE